MLSALLLPVSLASVLLCAGAAAEGPGVAIDEVVDVAPVWAGHPVRFALLTHGQRQFVAFYDDQRRMTVGGRAVGSAEWEFVHLPSKLGWDSHNYVTMAIDDRGLVHLSGNMHCVPLVYFRTSRPLDIASFEQVPAMVGQREKRCTYPRFLRGAGGELVFTYRDGGSGNGDQLFNVYDPEAKSWRRLLDEPLFSGEGKMNAYFVGPVRDAGGTFHVCWVWRDTPDCATNHDLSYARSKDLVHWETSSGRPLKLPITLGTGEVVDPVPAGGGLLNGNTRIGFDSQGRVVIGYHKFDVDGKTQIYNARREAGGWKIYQTSDWDYRWEFQGGGTIRFEIHLGPVGAGADGTLRQSWHHTRYGSGTWLLDERTLRPTGTVAGADRLPPEIMKAKSSHPGMEVRMADDLGRAEDPTVRYLLRWETLPANRDRPAPGELPPPSMLRVYRLREG